MNPWNKSRPCFSESKDGHGRVWNKILYVTRGESRFSSWVGTALSKRFFPRVIRFRSKDFFPRFAQVVNPPAGKICYFRPLLHNVLNSLEWLLPLLRTGSKRTLVQNLVSRAVNHPREESATFAPCYIM